MARFEITGTATDVFTLDQIQQALRQAGARKVRSRNAFGWRNQPHVATFEAAHSMQAEAFANDARALLRIVARWLAAFLDTNAIQVKP